MGRDLRPYGASWHMHSVHYMQMTEHLLLIGTTGAVHPGRGTQICDAAGCSQRERRASLQTQRTTPRRAIPRLIKEVSP